MMDFEWYVYGLAMVGAAVAGAINALAGSGSAVTLTVLVGLGLPAPVANGTNRVGILVQTLVSVLTLRQGGALAVGARERWLVAAAVMGAIGGAVVAADLDAATLNLALGVIMSALLLSVLLDPKRWLREQSEAAAGRPGVGLLLGFAAIGFYGGFVQAGVGVLLLAGLVVGGGYALVPANGVKNVIALCFTAPALLIFVAHDQVDWALGGLMAVGQAAGAWLASRLALASERARVWVRRLLIVVLVGGVVRFFGLHRWVMDVL